MSDWLAALGYDFDSLIPRVSFDGQLRPSRDVPRDSHVTEITSAFRCAYDQSTENLMSHSTVPVSLISGHPDASPISRHAFRPQDGIFGTGVVVAFGAGNVTVNVHESANPTLARFATVLLNGSCAVDVPSYVIDGSTTTFFVREGLSRAADDLRNLSVPFIDGSVAVIQNLLNASVGWAVDRKSSVDVRLSGEGVVINLRYGSTCVAERERVIKLVEERAVEQAWALQRELLRSRRKVSYDWSELQREELLSTGRVLGVNHTFVRAARLFPEIADDVNNVFFQVQSVR